jgi:hypothetical protein
LIFIIFLASILPACQSTNTCPVSEVVGQQIAVPGGSQRRFGADFGMLSNKIPINVHIPFEGNIAGTDLYPI